MNITEISKYKYFHTINDLHYDIFQQKRRADFFIDIFRPKRKYYLIMIDNQIAGYYAIFEHRKYNYIAIFGLKIQFQHRGFGNEIIQSIIDHNEKPSLTLHVDTQNKNALLLYKKYNFIIKKELKKFYKNKHSAYFMTKQKDT